MTHRTDRDVEVLLRGDDPLEPPEDLLEALRAEIPDDLGAMDESRVLEANVEPLRPARPVGLASRRRAWLAAAAVFVAVSASWLLFREVGPGAVYDSVAEQDAALPTPAVEEKLDTTRQAASAVGPTLEARAFEDVTSNEAPVLEVRDSDGLVPKAEVGGLGDLGRDLDGDVTAPVSAEASLGEAELGASVASPTTVAEPEEEGVAFLDPPSAAAEAAGARRDRAENLRPNRPAATALKKQSPEEHSREQREDQAAAPRFRGASPAEDGALWQAGAPWSEALSALRADRAARPGEEQRRRMLEALDDHPVLSGSGTLLLEAWINPELRNRRLPGLLAEIEALHAAGVRGSGPLLELARLLQAGEP